MGLKLILLLIQIFSFHCQKIKIIKTIDEIEKTASVPRGLNVKLLSDKEIQKLFEQETQNFMSITEANNLLNINQQDFAGRMFSSIRGNNETKRIHDMSKIALNVARKIVPYGYGTGQNRMDYIRNYQAPSNFCPYANKPYCDPYYPYRTADGSCNNLQNPWWGMKNTPLKRILRPIYNDYINEPRIKSVTGRYLPNPRTIAMRLHHPSEATSYVTNLFPHFGQFFDHDMSFTALTSDQDGVPIKCFCNNLDGDCFNIPIPKDDRINKDQRCIIHQRSASSFSKFNCNLGYREQINMNTAWLDLSQVYGSDLQTTLKLRLLYGGFMNVSVIRGMKKEYLPFKFDNCGSIPDGKPCFMAGDDRVNQQPLLLILQTIFVREHNRIAAAIGKLNPAWSDEKIFQETRKIVIAEYTHIVYKEYIPILVGTRVAKLYGLIPLNQGFLNRYDKNIYPNIANEFSTAAMRHGHTLVRSSFTKVDGNYRAYQTTGLKDAIFNTVAAFQKGGLDSYMRGCVFELAQRWDPHINDILGNRLFEDVDKDIPTKRFSLPAVNIQRARDHGIKGYNAYRALCGLNHARSIDEFYNIPQPIREILKTLYDHADDVDLFTGGISEMSIDGGIVGPTFACIFAKQLRDLKFGDRFYYELGIDKRTSFTYRQLDEIRKTSMARLLCDNVDLTFIQRNPFLRSNYQTNPLVSCENIEGIDLRAWKARY